MKSLQLSGPYMSLSALRWTDIPSLAIVTGLNGVGKTRFLRLLAAEGGVAHPDVDYLWARPSMELEPRPTSIGYLPALWQHTDVRISHEFFKPVNELLWKLGNRSRTLNALDELSHTFEHLISPNSPVAARVIDTLRDREKLTRTDVLAALGTYDLVTRNSAQPLVPLAQIFYAHANARITAFLRGDSADQNAVHFEKSPLEHANQFLRHFEMSFQLTGPDDLRFAYELLCHIPESGVTISPSELSSGEQAVLALVALVVTTSVLGSAPGVTNQNPELLLLDEPDSHLHTSAVKNYLEHVQQLTARGVQIIMVTHRPDTIALAPEDSLFEMRRDDGKTSIIKVNSKAELIGRLAADTIAVLPGVRVVLVEDEDDRRFHQWAYERALKLELLPANPRLVFMPVNATGGGGKSTVIKRLEALRKEGLGPVHRGLVDRDNDTTPSPPGVVSLGRYTLENYLADPIALYCAVTNNKSIDDKLQLSVTGGVTRGDLFTLRSVDVHTLQRIADLVLAKLEQASTLTDRERNSITLHGDAGTVLLSYPRWIFTTAKKDLRAAINQALGPAVLNDEHFHGGPELAGLVPADLVDVYRRLVTDQT